jgi:hypothetical protein
MNASRIATTGWLQSKQIEAAIQGMEDSTKAQQKIFALAQLSQILAD